MSLSPVALPDLTPIFIPDAWRELPTSEMKGTTVVLGACDAGKSTFARWLVGELTTRAGPTGWLDADVGQSSLGPPTTMNLAVCDSPPLPGLPAEATFFVGSTSPRAHMLPLLVGLQKLREKAAGLEAAALVVDTSGFIGVEGGGAALKQWKIELLRPAHVVALQREDELEPILEPLRREARLRLHVLPPAAQARVRSPAERAERRRELLERYFRTGVAQGVDASGIPVYGRGWVLPGQVLALQDGEGLALGLGVLLEARGEDRYRLLSPVDARGARSLRFGSARYPESSEPAKPAVTG